MPARALLALAVALLAGCGAPWWSARGRDAAQVLHVGVGASLTPGLYAFAAAPLFGTSLGWMRDGAYVGSDYGYALAWRQSAHGALVGGQLARAEWPRRLEDFGYRHDLDAYLVQSHFVALNVVVTDARARVHSTLPLSRFEVAAHALFVGASLGLDVVELFDLLAGLAGFDPVGDDGWTPPRAPFEPAPRRPDRPREHEPAPADEPAPDVQLESEPVGAPRGAGSAGAGAPPAVARARAAGQDPARRRGPAVRRATPGPLVPPRGVTGGPRRGLVA